MLWFMELTPWSGVTLGRLRYLINSPHFAEFGSNYHVLKDLLIFPDLLHLNPAHCLPSYFFKTHLNIDPPPQFTPTHSIGLLPSGFLVKIFCAFIISSSLPCTLPITKILCVQGRIYRETNKAYVSRFFTCTGPFQGPGWGSE